MGSSLFAKAILIVLFFFSCMSWAIMIKKFRRFRKIEKQGAMILKHFQRRHAFEILKMKINIPNHPYSEILERVKVELMGGTNSGANVSPQNTSVISSINTNKLDSLTNEINSVILQVMNTEESHVDFLATTSGVCPFLGLLGTVWGITESFWEIGLQSSASLPVVAPGLAEALITTIVGLLAAIPAVVGYNYFMGCLRRLNGKLEIFATYIITTIKKEVF
ncbi:MotA/TolQ/ExbB proton channel family protein [bacterium]|nr:MotA/TolQ/ExbB proton channel family protein [bacterium]